MSAPDKNCEMCRGTGWYGDNRPGIKGNIEFGPCECVSDDPEENCMECGGVSGKELYQLLLTRRLYFELIYAVGRAFPGEGRHETALRYIQEAERIVHGPAQEEKNA